MTGTWTYTESSNRVRVTGGTSGTPCTFSDYITADRTVATTACSIASGAELKAAAAVGASTDLTLTYSMRPVEFKGLRLAFTTAQAGGAAVSGDETIDIYGTTCIWNELSGAAASAQKVIPIADLTHNYQVGDTIIIIDISSPSTYETDTIASISEGVSITLTNNLSNSYAAGDIVGIYQTEQIDVSAAFGTYWSTLPYGQLAKVTCAGFDGTNTCKIDQPIWGAISKINSVQYAIDANTQIGDGSTSTYFETLDEFIYIADDLYFETLANGNITTGQIENSYPVSGSAFSWSPTDGMAFSQDSSTAACYATLFITRSIDRRIYFRGDSGEFIKCLFFYKWEDVGTYKTSIFFRFESDSLTIEDCFASNIFYVRFISYNLDVLNLHIHKSYGGMNYSSIPDVSITGLKITDASSHEMDLNPSDPSGTTLSIIDPNYTVTAVEIINQNLNEIHVKYTFNAHIISNGINLSGATVKLEGSTGTEPNSTDTTYEDLQFEVSTAADGTITEQNVIARKFVGTSETESNYNRHRLTVSKTGYETYIDENILIDESINYRVELQPIKYPISIWLDER